MANLLEQGALIKRQFFEMPKGMNLIVLATDALVSIYPSLSSVDYAFRYLTLTNNSITRVRGLLLLAHYWVRPYLINNVPPQVTKLLSDIPTMLRTALNTTEIVIDDPGH